MRDFYRLMLGQGSVFAPRCRAEGFVGTDFGIHEDLTGKLPEEWRAFNQKYARVYLKNNPGKSRIAAGLACGAIWTVSRGMANGVVVLCPNGSGAYHVGEIAGDYFYATRDILPHRRPVRWHDQLIDRSAMSDALKRSTGSIGTVSLISPHRDELEQLLAGMTSPRVLTTDPTVEDPATFALEKHLEDFLVENWAQTELAKDFDIYEEDGERAGQQYQTDTGPIDLLAVSKDKTRLLVIELKRGKASDAVVGQLLRYMGYVREEIAEEGQRVEGVIIALDDDVRVRRALSMVPAITFFRYQVSFKLQKA